MKKYQDSDILHAKELRRNEGYSFAELQRLTGIPATTIRNWCRELEPTNRWDTLLLSNQKKRQSIIDSERFILNTLEDISEDQAKIYASLLYWCEGWKYPSSNKVGFTNSDPELLQLFLTLLRKAFIIDETKVRVHLQLHTKHNVAAMKEYWSKILTVPTANFIKSTITTRKGGKHRREYFGTCTIRYPDYRIQLKLIGISIAFFERFGTNNR